jgi:hypothetical protein
MEFRIAKDLHGFLLQLFIHLPIRWLTAQTMDYGFVTALPYRWAPIA